MSDNEIRRSKSIATVCLSGTIEDKLAAAAAAGFDGVELFENDLIATSWTPEQVRDQCERLGLAIDLYQPFRDFEAAPAQRFDANLRRARHKFDLMERLGADTVLVCSSVAPDTVDDDDLAAEQLHRMAELAAERGLRIAYEALVWGRFVNTYTHSWEIVSRAGHPALGLCLDSFHILSRDSDPAGIADIPGEKLFFLQLADAPRLHMDPLQWSRHHRLFPGQGDFDLSGFLGRVLDAGYTGPLSLEVFNDVYRQADPHRTAVDAMRSLVSLEEAIGVRLPAAPQLNGIAFTELTVPEDHRPEFAATLSALGFTHTGGHRAKPVELWEQDAISVLVTTAPADDGDGASISTLAVDSADPAASVRRGEALLAPATAPAGSWPATVHAPDGARLGFGGVAAWRNAFRPTGTPPGPGTGLRRVDHIALTQPFDHFDEAALFFHSVLGLETEDNTEYAAPFGLVRARALSNSGHSVRIALSVARLRRGDEWSPMVPAPQHLAFASVDIFTTAAALREAGAPPLPIPGNYYDDLDARLAPSRLAELRGNDILYDRDSHGEFMHLYTPVLGDRVFFEVTQRIGDYRGYGTVNTPVRMAAHRRHRLAGR